MRNDASIRDEADLRLGKLAYQMGDMTEAGRRFGSLIGSQAAAPEAFFYLSSIAEREGRTDLALEGYTQARRSRRGPHRARPRGAPAAARSDDRAAAFRMLDEHAAKERSETLDVEFAKAALLEDVGQVDRGHRAAAARARAFPRSSRACVTRSRSSRTRPGMTRESVRSFESLLKDRPEDASLLNALGYSLADRNQKLPRAEMLIRKALVASPDNPAFLDSLGWVRFRRGDIPGALPHLERAYRIFPDAEIASHWGELLWVSGKQAEARALVGALARAFAGFQAAARHHRTPHRHEDGAAAPKSDAPERRRRDAEPPEAADRAAAHVHE